MKTMEVIERYAKLKLTVAKCEAEIDAIKQDFYEACAKTCKNGSRVVPLTESTLANSVSIEESKTRGIWKYSESIVAMEKTLKELKASWQESHKPTSGNEPIWIVRILKKFGV